MALNFAVTEIAAPQFAQLHTRDHLSPTNHLTDNEALTRWLEIYRARNLSTWRSYNKEAQRFRYFLAHQKDLAHSDQRHLLRDATEIDVVRFEAALAGKANNGIRPGLQAINGDGAPAGPFFKAPLKKSSVNLALSILHSMYEYWRQPDEVTLKPYVIANPVARVLRSTSRARNQAAHSVPQEAIAAMAELLAMHTKELAQAGRKNEIELAKTIRSHWILCLLFGLWLRRAEATSLRMNSFSRTHAGWEVHLDRKGDKEQTVPVPDWIMDVLFSYRASQQLPPAPAKDDFQPAILPVLEKGRRAVGQSLSPQTVYMEVKRIAKKTAEAVDAGQLLADLDVERRGQIVFQLKAFSPHWFRHTGATLAINSKMITVENASKMLGHSSTAITTAMYFHEDRDRLREGLNRMGSALQVNQQSS